MVGPFARSLRMKLGTLAFLLCAIVIGLLAYGARIAFRAASTDAARIAGALSGTYTNLVARSTLTSSSNEQIETALVRDFGGSGSLVAYAVVSTQTGEVQARSNSFIQAIPFAQWVNLRQLSGNRDATFTSCQQAPVAHVISVTVPVTNVLWNIFDPSVSCLGGSIRATEVIALGKLPKGLTGRTIVPQTRVYDIAAVIYAGLGVLVICLFTLLLFVHRRIVRPIRTIRQGAIIMAQGNLNHHIAVHNKDEIGVVANFINEVGRNLQKVRSELIDRQRIASELDAAVKIQQQLLPAEIPQVPGLQIAARTRPSTEVGGDNYDFIQLDEENTLIFIGDVTGHGVPAGLVMIMVDVLIDAFSSMHTSPKHILSDVNRILKPNIDSTMYMTMLMLGFNIKTQKLIYAAAGHEHIIHYHAATRKCSVTRSGGIALGMIPDISAIVKEQEIALEVGDCIVLYSDGITEAYGGRDGRDMFGLDRLVANVEKVGHRDAQGIFDTTTRALADFMGNAPQNDDITLMVLKYVGASQVDIDKAAKRIKLSVTEGEKKVTSKRWDWDKKVPEKKLTVTVPK